MEDLNIWYGDLKVPKELPYFQGHFPGNPILPAIGIIDGSLCAIEAAAPSRPGHGAISAQTVKAKFNAVVTPNMDIYIEVVTSKNSYTVKWLDKKSQKKLALLVFSQSRE